MSACLLVIDAQESFRQRPNWDDALAAHYLHERFARVCGVTQALNSAT